MLDISLADPLFQTVYPPPPLPRPGAADPTLVEVGVRIGGRGEVPSPLVLDAGRSANLGISGPSGSGKTVFADHLMYATRGRGWELVVVGPSPTRAALAWVSPFCRPGGFGASSTEQALAALALLREEVRNRRLCFDGRKAPTWRDLISADRERFPLILAYIDNFPWMTHPAASLASLAALDEDDPRRLEAAREAVASALIAAFVSGIAADGPELGVTVAVSAAPMPPGLSHRLRLDNLILFSGRGIGPAGKTGAGVAEFAGQDPCAVKGFFERGPWYADSLTAAGVPATPSPEPAAAEADRFLDDPDLGRRLAAVMQKEG